MPLKRALLAASMVIVAATVGLYAHRRARAAEPGPCVPLSGAPPGICKLHGKVKFVTAFPKYKIQIVSAFPDIKVKHVTAFPDKPGEWQVVDAFPDFTVQVVDAFPDFKVQYVEAFPGCP
jgi:hypothetical protein